MTHNWRSRITAIGGEEQEYTLNQRDKAQVAKGKYESNWEKLLRILEPGDQIAAERKNGMYEHHGIFEGRSKGYPSVIHFQGPTKPFVKRPKSRFCDSKCGYKQPEKGGPVVSCLDCFSQKGTTFKMQYQLNRNLLSIEDPNWNQLKPGKVIAGYRSKKYYLEYYMDGKLYGHSNVRERDVWKYELEDRVRYYEMFSGRSGKQVLDAAQVSKFVPYSLGCNNCEHFAVHCKTGMRRSVQVEKSKVPVFCEDGRHVCLFKARGTSDVHNEQENLNQEELIYRKRKKKNQNEKKKKKRKKSCSNHLEVLKEEK